MAGRCKGHGRKGGKIDSVAVDTIFAGRDLNVLHGGLGKALGLGAIVAAGAAIDDARVIEGDALPRGRSVAAFANTAGGQVGAWLAGHGYGTHGGERRGIGVASNAGGGDFAVIKLVGWHRP